MIFPIYLLTVFLGSTIQTVTGFGFGIFVMTIFPYLFPASSCAGLSALLSLTNNIVISSRFRRHLSFRRILWPLAGNFLFSATAIFLSSVSPDAILKKCLAVCLLLLSLYFLFFQGKLRFKESRLNGFIAGSLSGILTGFFSMGGPPMVVYLLNISDSNDNYMADIQTYFAISNIFSTAVRLARGMITLQILKLWAIGLFAMALGLGTGRLIFHQVDAPLLKRIIYCFMAASGVIFLF